jgi:hypothetical protein
MSKSYSFIVKRPQLNVNSALFTNFACLLLNLLFNVNNTKPILQRKDQVAIPKYYSYNNCSTH